MQVFGAVGSLYYSDQKREYTRNYFRGHSFISSEISSASLLKGGVQCRVK
jgi:hypothetical protein